MNWYIGTICIIIHIIVGMICLTGILVGMMVDITVGIICIIVGILSISVGIICMIVRVICIIRRPLWVSRRVRISVLMLPPPVVLPLGPGKPWSVHLRGGGQVCSPLGDPPSAPEMHKI